MKLDEATRVLREMLDDPRQPGEPGVRAAVRCVLQQIIWERALDARVDELMAEWNLGRHDCRRKSVNQKLVELNDFYRFNPDPSEEPW